MSKSQTQTLTNGDSSSKLIEVCSLFPSKLPGSKESRFTRKP